MTTLTLTNTNTIARNPYLPARPPRRRRARSTPRRGELSPRELRRIVLELLG